MNTWSLVMIMALAVGLTGCSRDELRGMVNITFEVHTPGLDDAALVYVVGNLPELGEWEADIVSMIRKPGDVWLRNISIPYGARMEYKFTLGSWEKEALNEHGVIPENHTLAATRSQTVRHTITQWRAPAEPSEGGITGEVHLHRGVEAEGLAARDVVVWLPPGYHDTDERYPVLYMHDGQNVFDPGTSFLGIDWGVDESADRLIREGAMKPVIVVGMYNSPQRRDEYGHGELGQAYQKFVVEVVKPLIDSTYRTRPERDDTAVMGSSMGGLVSFLLAWNYPEVFRQAACLSPAFFPDVVDMVRSAETAPPGMRVYMDNGTEGMEAQLQFMCDDMMAVLPEKGLVAGDNFEWFLDAGAEHNEAAWAARVHRPLLFMFGVDTP